MVDKLQTADGADLGGLTAQEYSELLVRMCLKMRKRRSQMKAALPRCARCNNSGWVCEHHDYIPWDEGNAECCGGAGAPCRDCNSAPNVMPRMEAGSRVMWTAADGWAN